LLVTGGTKFFLRISATHLQLQRKIIIIIIFFFKWSFLLTALEEKQMTMRFLIVSPITKDRDPECVPVHHDQEHDVMKPTIIHSYCSYREALICLI